MKRAVPILAGVSAVQLVLAAVLHVSGGRSQAASTAPMAQFERSEIDSMRIAAGPDSSVELTRAGEDTWQLPAADGFSADPARIDRVLSQLGSMETGVPIARSESARERFGVAREDYERRVELVSGGETVATVFFGESAGTGRVYARAQGQDTIREVSFALWQTPAQAGDWLDPSVPAVERQQIRQAKMPEFSLRRGEKQDQWQLVNGDAAKDASANEVSQLLGRLARPQIEGAAKAEPPDGESALAYTLTTEGGEEIRFRYYRTDGDAVHLHRSDQPWRYEVAASRLANLADTNPQTLLAGQSSGDDAQQANAQAGS